MNDAVMWAIVKSGNYSAAVDAAQFYSPEGHLWLGHYIMLIEAALHHGRYSDVISAVKHGPMRASDFRSIGRALIAHSRWKEFGELVLIGREMLIDAARAELAGRIADGDYDNAWILATACEHTFTQAECDLLARAHVKKHSAFPFGFEKRGVSPVLKPSQEVFEEMLQRWLVGWTTNVINRDVCPWDHIADIAAHLDRKLTSAEVVRIVDTLKARYPHLTYFAGVFDTIIECCDDAEGVDYILRHSKRCNNWLKWACERPASAEMRKELLHEMLTRHEIYAAARLAQVLGTELAPDVFMQEIAHHLQTNQVERAVEIMIKFLPTDAAAELVLPKCLSDGLPTTTAKVIPFLGRELSVAERSTLVQGAIVYYWVNSRSSQALEAAIDYVRAGVTPEVLHEFVTACTSVKDVYFQRTLITAGILNAPAKAA